MSLYVPPVVFGKNPQDNTPRRWNFFGQQGWWSVPATWFCRQNSDGTITASPNADFSKPNYDVNFTNHVTIVNFYVSLEGLS